MYLALPPASHATIPTGYACRPAWQYFEEGQLDAAMAAAGRSIELNPKFSEGLAVAGWVLTAQGKLDEALAEHLRVASADAAWKWPLGEPMR